MSGGRGRAHLGLLLDGVLANLDLRTRFREHMAVMGWAELAGKVVAAHSEAETVRDGVLIVAADTPVWAQELQMRQRELLGLIEKQIGPGVIRDIHFRSGRRRSLARRLLGAAAPAAQRQRPADIKLGGRQQKQIAEAAAKIEDHELRERAERAFGSLARMAEWRKQDGWRQCRRCGRWQRVGRHWCSTCSHAGGRRKR